jgi:transposase
MSASFRGDIMLGLFGSARIFLYQEPVSMRKSFEGLSLIVENNFEEKIMSGAFFAFLNKKKDHLKVLYWDTDGLAIWYKRLEKGSFAKQQNSSTMLSRREFFLLLEGLKPKNLQKRFTCS